MIFSHDLMLEDIPDMPDVIQELNYQLAYLGFLDPPFALNLKNKPGPMPLKKGPSKFNSCWKPDSIAALRQAMALYGVPIKDDVISAEVLNEIMNAVPAPLQPGNSSPECLLAYRIAMRMEKEGFYINRGLGVNTAYVEGVSIDGTLNNDAANEWNDLCVWFTVSPKGSVFLLGRAICTTEPGRFYTVNPLNNKGAARIAFGQYKSWMQGLHKNIQPALVLSGGVKIYRDTDRSMTRSARDIVEIAYNIGLNQHSTGPRVKAALVGKYSAGCLVKEDYDLYLQWLNESKGDYRFAGNVRYEYIAAVMAGPID